MHTIGKPKINEDVHLNDVFQAFVKSPVDDGRWIIARVYAIEPEAVYQAEGAGEVFPWSWVKAWAHIEREIIKPELDDDNARNRTFSDALAGGEYLG